MAIDFLGQINWWSGRRCCTRLLCDGSRGEAVAVPRCGLRSLGAALIMITSARRDMPGILIMYQDLRGRGQAREQLNETRHSGS